MSNLVFGLCCIVLGFTVRDAWEDYKAMDAFYEKVYSKGVEE